LTKAIFEGASITYSIEVDGIVITARQFHRGQKTFQAGEPVLVSLSDGQFHTIQNS
jgi:hypothetical protein